mgnify:CR=1 FL=1
MKHEEILKKAIKKAIKNGWSGWVVSWKVIPQGKYPRVKLMGSEQGFEDSDLFLEQLIYQHDFAKAFFGEKEVGTYDSRFDSEPAWTRYLQEMVLASEPLKYLEEFVSEK